MDNRSVHEVKSIHKTRGRGIISRRPTHHPKGGGAVFKGSTHDSGGGRAVSKGLTLLRRRSKSGSAYTSRRSRRSRSSVAGDTAQTHIYFHSIIAYEWILIHSIYYLLYSYLFPYHCNCRALQDISSACVISPLGHQL